MALREDGAAGPAAQPDCAYNYVVTAQRPAAVTHSVVGRFTSADDINLIISKKTRIEIHTLAEGLQGVADVPIYGRVAAMELFRPPGKDKDLLFLLTETHAFSILEYDTATGELVTQATGDASSKVGRTNENGSLGLVDPGARCIALHIYDAIFKIIPVGERGRLQEAFDVRTDEMCCLDAAFLDGRPGPPLLAVLHEDARGERHVRTYEVSLRDKAFAEGPWSQANLDAGAAMLIPVPAPLGGALVVGESVVSYLNKGEVKTVALEQTTVRAFGRVDEDGSRFLLGNLLGQLHLLVLQHDGRRVLGLKLQALGRTSAPATISYLDNAVVFVGSATGDSQLVRLHPAAPDPARPADFVEVLESFANLGPIVDMAVVDLDRQGQCQVVTCSGARGDGSLRVVRSGIGMVGQASAELPGVRGLWSLRASSAARHDSLLVLAFVGETRLLAINEADELEEAEPEGFDAEAQSLFCGNCVGDTLVQVTPGGARLLAAADRRLLHEWRPPAGQRVNLAAGNATQVLLAGGEGRLVLLQVAGQQLREAASHRASADVACLDVSPLDPEASESRLAAVGRWDRCVHLLRLPGLQPLVAEQLGGDVIPRSLLLVELGSVPYLLVALGDGQLLNFRLAPDSGALSERKQLSLGTKPIALSAFRAGGRRCVFAASDRPTVVHASAAAKLVYVNLNEDEVNFMAPFNSASFPDSLAIAKEGALTIGSIDEVQKLHIRCVPLGCQPRRVAHAPAAKAYLLVTSPALPAPGSADTLQLLDEQTFEPLASFGLQPTEQGCSVATARFADDSEEFVAVGTAFVNDDEPEPSKGRILVFSVKGGQLALAGQKEVKGAPYSVAAFQGKLLAGVNSRVQVLRWQRGEEGGRELALECSHAGHVLALHVCARGDFVVVGDLMRSVSVLQYSAEEQSLAHRARDFSPGWTTAVAALDDDTFLAADNSCNLLTLRKRADSANDEERGRLEAVGEWHLGDMVNRFQPGSLVMQLADGEAPRPPTQLFGTLGGAIGVVAALPPPLFDLLERLQGAVRKVIRGVGGLQHTGWRLLRNERGVMGCRGFVDGDLVEQFLDLDGGKQARVAQAVGGGATVEQLQRTVEELSRALH